MLAGFQMAVDAANAVLSNGGDGECPAVDMTVLTAQIADAKKKITSIDRIMVQSNSRRPTREPRDECVVYSVELPGADSEVVPPYVSSRPLDFNHTAHA